MALNYVKPERLWLKEHPELNERWLQDRIAADPALLGLGELVLKDRERPQPRAGRLDLLLQDPDSNQRYEVKLQLGSTDEAHIIRTIEYWDIERKRYPQSGCSSGGTRLIAHAGIPTPSFRTPLCPISYKQSCQRSAHVDQVRL